ncbi:MAG: hypothetical protein WBA45_09955 [Microthrixaceae bacterium]
MRKSRVLIGSIFLLTMSLSVTACTPEAQEGVGRTLGQLVTWWLWTLAHAPGSGYVL